MPFNGSGSYAFPSNSWNPAVAATNISSTDWNSTASDLATALSTCLTKDGQTTATALIPFAQGASFGGASRFTSGGLLGLGMTPTNILDITQNQDASSIIQLLNSSSGSSAQGRILLSNGTQLGGLTLNGASFTSTPGRLTLQNNGEIFITTVSGANPIMFAVNGSESGRFGTDSSFLVGTTTNAGAGNVSVGGGKIYGQAATGTLLQLGAGSTTQMTVDTAVHAIYGQGDNTTACGYSSVRWTTVYAATGTINTSDEREKSWRGALAAEEIAASKDILKAVGGFQFLSAIKEKGESARLHIGFKAQQVRDILAVHGLNPLSYAFLCYDKWEASHRGPAGDRWGLRTDELAFFLMAGLDARLMEAGL